MNWLLFIMKKEISILIFCFTVFLNVVAQDSPPDFQWGDGFYFNMNAGDIITFNNVEVELMKIENHYNQVRIGKDTLWMKVARRSLPFQSGNIRIFIADNRNVKELTNDSPVHGLLIKDALICLCYSFKPFPDPGRYFFPVSFNDGFMWSMEENSYLFSWSGKDKSREEGEYYSYPGIGFDLHGARGLEKHWLVAIEDSRVAWISDEEAGRSENEVCVLLESRNLPGIYYIYNHLYKNNLLVKEGQEIMGGELIGTAWGDEEWCHLQFAVVKSDTIPVPENCFQNVVNGFPQIYSLYFGEAFNYVRNFTKGRIHFGKPKHLNGNNKNNLAYQSYSGKGWKTGRWNAADKMETVTNGEEGNVRLKKVLFRETPAECKNPFNYYEYEINVINGVYRIRAEAGDVLLPSWQRIEFEGVTALTASLGAGEFEWTTERVVKVEDGKLTIRIYIDEKDTRPAGIREVVFQGVY
jgi:hypothetical protein